MIHHYITHIMILQFTTLYTHLPPIYTLPITLLPGTNSLTATLCGSAGMLTMFTLSPLDKRRWTVPV